MTIKNAIKKAERMIGEKVEEKNGEFIIKKNKKELSCIKSGEEAMCFRTRGLNDHDNINTDYFAGVFWDNLTQAINSII